jgi:aspartyl-tRNA synthetase
LLNNFRDDSPSGSTPGGPSKNELKKRAKAEEKERKAAEKAAKLAEQERERAEAEEVRPLLYLSYSRTSQWVCT